jgi:orotidine-5'-phosphate decarboxylase
MANRLIVALDMTTVEDARRMATLLAGTAVSFFKIGLARDRPRRRPRAGVC